MKLCLECHCEFDASSWDCPACSSSPVSLEGQLSFAPNLAFANDGFRLERFDQLFEHERKNFWFRSRNKLIVWGLRKYFPRARSFLEIGCGSGFVLHGIQRACPGLSLYGAELYLYGLRVARARVPRASFLQMDAREIPFSNEFDVIGAFDVLEHIEEDRDVLRNMYKAVSRDGGGIILTVPQHKELWSTHDEYARHCRRYEADELRDKVREAGFKVVKVTSFVSVLLPLFKLVRSRKKLIEEHNPVAELKINPLVNAALEMTLSGERLLLKSGISLKKGSSLLLIAKK